jgi:hypothetical protein
LNVGVEFEPSEHFALLLAWGGIGEDDVRVAAVLAEGELSELKELDLHRVAHHFSSLLQPDDGVVGRHIAKDIKQVGLHLETNLQTVPVFSPIFDNLMKIPLVSRDNCFKIHEVLSERACLIETAETDISSHDHLILLDAEDTFLLELSDRIDHPESHTDWQSSRHRDGHQI